MCPDIGRVLEAAEFFVEQLAVDAEVPWMVAGGLNADTLPAGIDVIPAGESLASLVARTNDAGAGPAIAIPPECRDLDVFFADCEGTGATGDNYDARIAVAPVVLGKVTV